MNLDHLFFRSARLIAEKSDMRIRMGATLVKNRKLISLGHNHSLKTHPRMAKEGHFTGALHAELDALLGQHKHDLSGADMYVYRIKANGSHGMARPCPRCWNILLAAGIRRVYYTNGMPGTGINWEKVL